MILPPRSWLAALSLSVLVVMPQSLSSQQGRRVAGRPTSGFWIFAISAGADTNWVRFTLRFEGDSVLGENAGGSPLTGALRGDSVRFSFVRRDNGGHVVIDGVLRGDTLRGTRVETPPGSTTPPPGLAYIATPEAAMLRAPRRSTFAPKTFYRAFSGAGA